MRKPRAILYDDDPVILEMLTMFFEELGYEVIANNGPVACPVYQDGATCHDRNACGDIMITDLVMPKMSGLEMLALQAERGCKIEPRNKAVHSGSLEPGSLVVIRKLGCRFFHKPAPLADIKAWVRECESRMDLSQPLGVLRRERREACASEHVVAVGPHGEEYRAQVVNRSDSGSCLRFDQPLEVGQVIDVRANRQPPTCSPATGPVEVRWSKPDAEGRFLSGIVTR